MAEDFSCRYCRSEDKESCKCGPWGYKKTSVAEGEWIQPIRKGYTMSCCDCGLVHVMNFRIRKGKVQFQAFRKELNAAEEEIQ